MSGPVWVNLVVEDSLSEAVVLTILRQCKMPYLPGFCFGKKGAGFIKQRLAGFNQAARRLPYIVLTDLDSAECPATLVRSWLPEERSPYLIFRIAVREVEAWVLADTKVFADFFGVRQGLISARVEQIRDPKQELIRIVGKSKNRDLRDAIVPPQGSTRTQGPDYNGRLIAFVENSWSAVRASKNAPSLKRMMQRLEAFEPPCVS